MRNPTFRDEIATGLSCLLEDQAARFPPDESLTIDLHCHDHNSDVPDELLGRILRLPETWLPTERLLSTLARNRVDVVTVTNHNNSRSCWELLEKGRDVLVGAEFSCTLPNFEVGVHVLTYGFTPEQEERLQILRKNLYRFLEFACEHDIPTILAHPLHFYSPKGEPPLELFDTLALLFERFEVINGQRDSWQNMLTAAWIESLTEERLNAAARRVRLRPGTFCRNPYQKSGCGGSDDHMGIFAGFTGSRLHVPGLESERSRRRLSELALEALRAGRIVPFGSYNEEEKLGLALLDYFCQATIHMKDPGLVRMLLHRGSAQDKMVALLIANAMLELRRHRFTLKFLTASHEALSGKRPRLLDTWKLPRSWRPVLDQIDSIAALASGPPQRLLESIRSVLPQMYSELGRILARNVERNLKLFDCAEPASDGSRELVRRFELPSHLRALFGNGNPIREGEMSSVNLSRLFDGLSFPALATFVIAGSSFASNRVQYKNRAFVNRFARRIGRYKHPRRALWLTDTLFENNGVSSVLAALLDEVRKRDLPIDLFVCRRDLAEEDHLLVLPPAAEFRLPFYRSQVFRIPDLLQVQQLFRQRAYDRVVCSTEFVMGLLALYLKLAFSVPAFFYVHSAWLDFADTTLGLDLRSRDRVRRVLRAFYRSFDGLFVLNTEQRNWLAGTSMGISPVRIFRTSHWVDHLFQPQIDRRGEVFPGTRAGEHVLLFAGRLSEEKGIFELPGILRALRSGGVPVRMVIAGEGPAAERLKAELPEAVYLGWVRREDLPAVYSSADLLLLPSRFDTFGCVVLEAMSCGLPLIAYNTKGPRDLILDGATGFLVETSEEFEPRIRHYLNSPRLHAKFRESALARGRDYNADEILNRLLDDIGLGRLQGVSPPAAGPPRGISDFLEDLMEIVAGD